MRANKIGRERQEARNPACCEVPQDGEAVFGIFGLKKKLFLRFEACEACKLKNKNLLL